MSPLNPTAPPFLPSITSLPTLSASALASTLDLLFEPSAELHALALPTLRAVSFESYGDLVATLRDQLLQVQAQVRADPAGRARLHGVLAAHPRLGQPRAGSRESEKEQGSLDGAAEELRRCNAEYERRFPGLRYVVFVNGRGREAVLGDMRRRIDRGDSEAEEKENIEAMCEIANDRAAKLLAAVPAPGEAS